MIGTNFVRQNYTIVNIFGQIMSGLVKTDKTLFTGQMFRGKKGQEV